MGGVPPAMRLIGIGWYVAICIGGGVLAGVWLDSQFDIRPVLTPVGLSFGLFMAFWGAYRMLMEVLAAIGPKKRG